MPIWPTLSRFNTGTDRNRSLSGELTEAALQRLNLHVSPQSFYLTYSGVSRVCSIP
jgi:hypothetical protein